MEINWWVSGLVRECPIGQSQDPREDDLVSYEKYQLVILGVLHTRVTYWYTYRLPKTYLPT